MFQPSSLVLLLFLLADPTFDSAPGLVAEIKAARSGPAAPAIAFSPDGRLLVCIGEQGTIGVWSARGGKEVQRLKTGQGVTTALAFAADGQTLAMAGQQPALLLCDLGGTREPRPVLRDGRAGDLAFSADGKSLAVAVSSHATAASPEILRLVDVPTGKPGRELAPEQRGMITALGFSGDGKLLFLARKSGTIYLVDVSSGKELRRLRLRPGPVAWTLDSATTGKLVTAGGLEHSFLVTDLGNQESSFRLWAEKETQALALSPDGRVVALAGKAEPWITVLEVITGKARLRLGGVKTPSRRLLFSPDGNLLAAVGPDGMIRVWDLAAAGTQPAGLAWRPDALWADLGSEEADKAYAAILTLAAAPRKTLPFLQERWQTPLTVDHLVVALLPDLGSDRFPVREKAAQELLKLGPAAAPAVRKALVKAPSLDVSRRLQKVLDRLEVLERNLASSPWHRSCLRAVEALERIGTAEAQQLLQQVARRAANDSWTREAQAALLRLERQRK
jgi:hypothetical protein